MGICLSKNMKNKVTIMNNNNNNITIQFTRYLYEKDEVQLALMMSILNKKDDEAVFWAYELFYSGFTFELANLLWSIYYDFYASLNPAFEKYLQTKLKHYLDPKKLEADKQIAMIINNFIIRPFSLDVFLMRMFVTNFSVDKSYMKNYFIHMDFKIAKKELLRLLEEKEYILLAAFILEDILDDHIINAVESILIYFISKGLTLDNKKIINEFKIILNVFTWSYPEEYISLQLKVGSVINPFKLS